MKTHHILPPRPDDLCPNCGQEDGFGTNCKSWDNKQGWDIIDYCIECGWERKVGEGTVEGSEENIK